MSPSCRATLTALAFVAGLGTASYAGEPIPDTELSTTSWDARGRAFVVPGQEGTDLLTYQILDGEGESIVGAEVEVVFTGCDDLCIDSPDAGLTGTTDETGEGSIDPAVGGCDVCTVTIEVDGTVLRTFSLVSSPDWDGTQADGVVDCSDQSYFEIVFGGAGECADYDGNGTVELEEFGFFQNAFGASNQETCPAVDPPGIPSPSMSAVSPWDTYGHAFVSPGSNQSGVDELTVNLADDDGNPIPSRMVHLRFIGCDAVCVDPESPATFGFTDVLGNATIDPAAGGCDDCTVEVIACGIVIRSFDRVTSPDWDGVSGNGIVDEEDQAHFEKSLGGDLCYDVDGDGEVLLSDTVIFNQAVGDANPSGPDACAPVAVPPNEPPGPSRVRHLLPARPNPTTGRTIFSFTLPGDGAVSLGVFDVAGRRVGVALDEPRQAGTHGVAWNAVGADGEPLPAGVYFVRLESGPLRETRSFVVAR